MPLVPRATPMNDADTRPLVVDAAEPPKPGPLVPWWSAAKTVLAAAALVLVERRVLDLDALMSGAPYMLRHLLQHTSGLPDYGSNPDYHLVPDRARPERRRHNG